MAGGRAGVGTAEAGGLRCDLASSKTAAEIAPLRDAMGLADWPAITENGSGLLEPGADGTEGAQTYRELRAAIARLPKGFTGFGDMTHQDIAAHTGLTPDDAIRAQARQFSEPGLWTGPDAERDAFLATAQDAGLTVQQGGRFLTLSFGGTKADRMDQMIERYRPEHTLALGDAPNDVAMLERAEIGVVVANPASPASRRLRARTALARRADASFGHMGKAPSDGPRR